MFKKLLSSELGKGAIILFITINIFNFLNYLFHFVMGHMLGPEDYGVLAVLMSVLTIYNIPTEAIQNLISRYSSKLNLKDEKRKIKFLIISSLKKGLKISLLIFILATIITFPLSKLLKINFWLFFISNFLIFYSFLGPINKGVMQGQKRFGYLGINFMLEAGLKLFFAISFVIFGFKIFGAVMGILMGVSSGLIFSFYFNKDILKEKAEKFKLDEFKLKEVSYFITTIIIFVALSLDIILAKIFFSAEVVGKYSVISMIGKMIFFGTIAISKTMFPLTSEKHDKNENPIKIFKKSLIIVIVLEFLTILLFAFFPKDIIGLLYGNQYTDMAYLLVYSGISLSFLSLVNLNLYYCLSTKGVRKPYYLFIFLIIEIVLLCTFNENIMQYTISFMVSNIIMFIGSLFLIK